MHRATLEENLPRSVRKEEEFPFQRARAEAQAEVNAADHLVGGVTPKFRMTTSRSVEAVRFVRRSSSSGISRGETPRSTAQHPASLWHFAMRCSL